MTKILIVDDSRVIQHVLQAHLSSLDSELVAVASAEEALRAFGRDRYEVVISDIHMPGMSGVELSRRLKAESDAVKVILISSGKGSEGDDAYARGQADAFFAKPIDGQRLSRLVRTFLEGDDAGSSGRLSAVPEGTIRVVAADDTRVGRKILERILRADTAFELVGMASDGLEAVELAITEKPRLVIVDALMPGIDGIEATRRIMQRAPTRVVIVTESLTARSAKAAFEATQVGALDLMRRPSFVEPNAPEAVAFRNHLKELAEVPVIRRRLRISGAFQTRRSHPPALTHTIEIVGICGSTGGPRVLAEMLPKLKATIERVPVLVVQHVLADFDAALTRWLRETTGVPVQLAADGDRVRSGAVLVAPSGHHLVLANREKLELTDAPAVGGHRPSGTPLFEGLATHYGEGALGVVLSGMGEDGLDGLRKLAKARGVVLAQSPDTCVVAGMPEAVVAEGLAAEILAPAELAAAINARVVRREGGD